MVHELIEPVAVTDVFASGIARVEPLGNGLARLTFFARQTSLYENIEQGVVVARIVVPIRSLVAARPAVDIAAAEQLEGAVGEILVTQGRPGGH